MKELSCPVHTCTHACTHTHIPARAHTLTYTVKRNTLEWAGESIPTQGTSHWGKGLAVTYTFSMTVIQPLHRRERQDWSTILNTWGRGTSLFLTTRRKVKLYLNYTWLFELFSLLSVCQNNGKSFSFFSCAFFDYSSNWYPVAQILLSVQEKGDWRKESPSDQIHTYRSPRKRKQPSCCSTPFSV